MKWKPRKMAKPRKVSRPSVSKKLDTIIALLRQIAKVDHPVRCGRCNGSGITTKGFCDLCDGSGLLGRKR